MFGKKFSEWVEERKVGVLDRRKGGLEPGGTQRESRPAVKIIFAHSEPVMKGPTRSHEVIERDLDRWDPAGENEHPTPATPRDHDVI